MNKPYVPTSQSNATMNKQDNAAEKMLANRIKLVPLHDVNTSHGGIPGVVLVEHFQLFLG